jgi:hypothetical protein
VSRFGYRAVFAAGFVLLGAPAFALGAVPTAPGTSSPAVSRRWSALRPDYGFYTLMSEHEELAVG